MKNFITLLLLFACHSSVIATEIEPFTTDGCSSFPDGTLEQQSLWLNCCVRHDLAYWMGGTEQQRLQADERLAQCVAKAGEPEIARVMLAGVRAGGSPHLPTTYRWGYGWPMGRGYQALSAAEKKQIREHLSVLEKMIEVLKEELRNK